MLLQSSNPAVVLRHRKEVHVARCGGRSLVVSRAAHTHTTASSSVTAEPQQGNAAEAPQPRAAVEDHVMEPHVLETSNSAASFSWTRNWWPLASLDMLDRERPNPHTILNQDLVVWYRKEDDTWHVFKDRCPHRLTALSEGRIENGSLVCSYHGWSFGPSGACNKIPQIKAEDQQKVCSNKKTCVDSYPVLVESGMLYVWLDNSTEGVKESKTRGPPLVAGPASPTDVWAVQEVPNDFKLWLEQAMDPSHANFLHAGAVYKPADARPMEATTIPTVHPTQGFSYEHGGYEVKNMSMKATRTFVPPGTVIGLYRQAFGTLVLHTSFVPVKPGVCRTTAMFRFLPPGVDAPIIRDSVKYRQEQQAAADASSEGKKAASPPAAARAKSWFTLPNRFPNLLDVRGMYRGLIQAVTGLVLVLVAGKSRPHWPGFFWGLPDQDVMALHTQQRNLLDPKHPDKSYVMPAAGADVGVAGVGRWMRMVGYPHSLYGSETADRNLTLEQVMDRQKRHVKHCVQCQKGFARLTKACQVLTGAVAAAAVFTLGCLASALVCRGNLMAAGWPAVLGAAVVALLGPATNELWDQREYRFINGAKAWRKAGGLSLLPRAGDKCDEREKQGPCENHQGSIRMHSLACIGPTYTSA